MLNSIENHARETNPLHFGLQLIHGINDVKPGAGA